MLPDELPSMQELPVPFNNDALETGGKILERPSRVGSSFAGGHAGPRSFG